LSSGIHQDLDWETPDASSDSQKEFNFLNAWKALYFEGIIAIEQRIRLRFRGRLEYVAKYNSFADSAYLSFSTLYQSVP